MACPVRDIDVSIYNLYVEVSDKLGNITLIGFINDYVTNFNYACLRYRNEMLEGSIEQSAKSSIETYYKSGLCAEMEFKNYLDKQLNVLKENLNVKNEVVSVSRGK